MLPQLKIHVDGSGSVFRTAERGVLHIHISSTGTDQNKASSNVQQAAAALTTRFRTHAAKKADGTAHPLAGITAFSASAISREREYTASSSFEVIFRDFELLASITAELAGMPFVSITRTEWRLTADTKAQIAREARIKAIENAVEKANDYAAVVGRRVAAVEIKDGASTWDHKPRFYHPLAPFAHMQMQQQQQQQQQQQIVPQSAGLPPEITQGGSSVGPTTVTASAEVNVRFVSLDGESVESMES